MAQGYKKDGTPTNPTGKGGFNERPQDRGKGMTSEAKKAWHRANEAGAELAAIIMETHLAEAQEKLSEDDRQSIIDQLTPTVVALIKQAADRVEGTPKQSVDISSPDGSMSPVDYSGAVLEAIKAKHGKPDA